MSRSQTIPARSIRLSTLNDAQRQAVSTLAGPLLVLAGAGTGKTRVVTYRIANLIAHGTSPSRILAVTFTNKAAREMQQRAAELLGRAMRIKPEISTFHSLCVRILRRHIDRLGYPQQFAIYSRPDQEGVARAALREISAPSAALRPGDLLAIISRWKSRGIDAATAMQHAESDREHLAAVAFRRYQAALRAVGAVDFDDLLLCTQELFAKFAEVRRAEAKRFDHLLIDEYQDTNDSQYRIVKALASGHRNLCVVGDDDQSIYGWRGAEVEHILRFQVDWPDAKVVRLEQNYRSSGRILAFANALIANNQNRHPKILIPANPEGPAPVIHQAQSEDEEAEFVAKDLKQFLAEGRARPNDFAILFRTNEQPRPFEQALRKANIPYVLVGASSFYDRREVQDVLAYLKLAADSGDEMALLRIINTPARGIGRAAVTRLREAANAQRVSACELLARPDRIGSISPKAAGAMQQLHALIQRYHHAFENRQRGARRSLADCARQLLAEVRYQDEILQRYDEPAEQEARTNSVEQVINALASFAKRTPQGGLQDFLNEIALASFDEEKDKESQLDRNAVGLMTLHSAKGLEFPHVYLVGMEEGLLPHRRAVEVGDSAIDEERRLCYVGVTRAQRRLTLSLALSRQKWGKARPTQPSRYLFELTGQSEKAAGRKDARTGRLVAK